MTKTSMSNISFTSGFCLLKIYLHNQNKVTFLFIYIRHISFEFENVVTTRSHVIGGDINVSSTIKRHMREVHSIEIM